MNERAVAFAQSRLTGAHQSLKSAVRDEQGLAYPQRNMFIKVKKYVDDFLGNISHERWIIIPGLRGIGKSTLLAQTYIHLAAHGVDSKHMLHFSLDDAKDRLDLSLDEILSAYEYTLGGDFSKLREKIFIFIDEVQSDPKWDIVLKTSIYDKAKNVFLLVTGSSAVSLQASADVSRRAIIEKLYPMNFTEFQIVKNRQFPEKGLKKRIQKAILFSDSAKSVASNLKIEEKSILDYWSRVSKNEIDEYLTIGTLPFAVKRDPNKIFASVRLLVDRIVDTDIRALGKFKNETLISIKRLLFLLADATDVISGAKLADLCKTNFLTLTEALGVLEKAEVLIKATPIGSNTGKMNKPAKYLFMSPTYRLAQLSIAGNPGTELMRQGKLIEDVVAEYIYREVVSKEIGTLSYDPAAGGADFIVELTNTHRVAFEVCRGDKKQEKLKQLRQTMGRGGFLYGVMISYQSGEIEMLDDDIICIPLSTFLLM